MASSDATDPLEVNASHDPLRDSVVGGSSNLSYEQEINNLINSLQQYNSSSSVSDRSELDGYYRILQKLRQNIQLFEMNETTQKHGAQQFKQQLKYYQNRYNVLERQYLLSQHVSGYRSDEDDEEDLEYGNGGKNSMVETQRLLESSEDSLRRSLSLLDETEKLGGDTLGVLHEQKSQMENTKHKLRSVHSDLQISDQLIGKMTRTKYIIMAIVIFLTIIVVVLVILIIYGWVTGLKKE